MDEETLKDIEKSQLVKRDLLYRERDIFERQAQMASLITKLFIPISFLLIAVMLLEPAKNLISQYERILVAEANGMERLPELKKQINVLEKQLANLSSQSIESRLSKIEKSIALGDVDVDEIATLQKLKSDFEVLKTYMFSDPEDLVKLKTLQRDYQEISIKIDKYIQKDVVEREINYLTNMFYTVLAFLGVLVSLAGGSWWFTSRKLKSLNKEGTIEI
jgi:hypothetical protein